MDFKDYKPIYKETYGRLKTMIKGKAKSELQASKNPKKFMEENKEPSIKNRKGIAF